MSDQKLQPLVSVGVMIFKDGMVLLGKRKGSHGAGEYAFPGGHLDYMESFEDCAKRETFEETGMQIQNIRLVYVANIVVYDPKHYVNIMLVADWVSGDPMVCEPEKCEGWQWYDLENLPNPIFRASGLGIDSYKTGKNYYDQIQ